MRIFPILPLLLWTACRQPATDAEWPTTGGGKENTRHSHLTQIDTANVGQLAPAWVYSSGDADTARHSQIQCNPIVIGGVLYGTTPGLRLFALDAATGRHKWTFDPSGGKGFDKAYFYGIHNNRGVAYWSDGGGDARIFFSAGHWLYAVDASTGRLLPAFGDSGRVDLHAGLGEEARLRFVNATSPGIVYRDLLILGSRVDEAASAAPGHLRAFDVRTGKVRWIFRTIPAPGEPGSETWDDPQALRRVGGANSWAGLSLDEGKGIVFVPTGSASFDFYGGKRLGGNLYANSLIALEAATGRRIWHFQTVHHDVWDRDLPTAPALVTVTHNRKKTEAVAQPTKSGYVYLFERTTGRPLFPVEERAVPTDTELPGERLSPTQPRPLLPQPFARQAFRDGDVNRLVPDSTRAWIKGKLAGYRRDDIFAPPTRQGTVILPGYDGGAEWGGPAFDPSTGYLYVNANEMPWVLTMVDRPLRPLTEDYAAAGRRLYKEHCQSCHGTDGKGTGNYPSLENVASRYTPQGIEAIITHGRRMMPAFTHLTAAEKDAVVRMLTGDQRRMSERFPPQPIDTFLHLPFGMTGYNKFLTPQGLPAIDTPWGTLNAIDLNTGRIAWRVPLGTFPEFGAKGIMTGTENYGGPVVTAGGLVFIAATRDAKIRAFHKRTGRLLWEHDLPAPGFATPSVYSIGGRQYLVIACGGGKMGTRSGDSYVAFTLPSAGGD